jgi:hypothetical protein
LAKRAQANSPTGLKQQLLETLSFRGRRPVAIPESPTSHLPEGTTAMADCPQSTTGAGNSIADHQNFKTAGPSGSAS